MNASTVDWDFWFALPLARLWQAVALSLDIDPDRMDQSRDYWRDGPSEHDVPIARDRAAFRDRLALLIDSRTDSTYFTSGSSSSDTPANHRAELKEVVRWLTLTGQAPIAARLLGQDDATPADIADATSRPIQAPERLTPHEKAHAWEEEQILRTTRSSGFDPLALPPDDQKTNFAVKALIRSRCANNHSVKMRASIFNNAWSRMVTSVPARLRFSDS